MKRILLLSLVVSTCAPKVIVTNPTAHNPSKAYEPFVVFEVKDTISFTKNQMLSDIQVKDGGFVINCDYETVSRVAIERAKQVGANAIKIYEHKLPNPLWSTCHRIKATALRIDDIWKYEKRIAWYPERKLQIKDFKGNTQNRPFQAATATYFNSTYTGTPISGKITVKAETIFDCEKSYFKSDTNLLLLYGTNNSISIFLNSTLESLFKPLKSTSRLTRTYRQITIHYLTKSSTTFIKNKTSMIMKCMEI